MAKRKWKPVTITHVDELVDEEWSPCCSKASPESRRAS
jgi:hypothetical protein